MLKNKCGFICWKLNAQNPEITKDDAADIRTEAANREQSIKSIEEYKSEQYTGDIRLSGMLSGQKNPADIDTDG